jgi:hypothetical protein
MYSFGRFKISAVPMCPFPSAKIQKQNNFFMKCCLSVKLNFSTGVSVTKPRFSDESVKCSLRIGRVSLSVCAVRDPLSSQIILVTIIVTQSLPHTLQIGLVGKITWDLFSKENCSILSRVFSYRDQLLYILLIPFTRTPLLRPWLPSSYLLYSYHARPPLHSTERCNIACCLT